MAANLFVETDALECAQTIPAVLGELSGDGSAMGLIPRETACDGGTARSAFRNEMDLEAVYRGHHNPYMIVHPPCIDQGGRGDVKASFRMRDPRGTQTYMAPTARNYTGTRGCSA